MPPLQKFPLLMTLDLELTRLPGPLFDTDRFLQQQPFLMNNQNYIILINVLTRVHDVAKHRTDDKANIL